KPGKNAGSTRADGTGATEDAAWRRVIARQGCGGWGREGHVLPTVRRIASSTSEACGTTNSSITGANGSGVNFEPTRSIGASSQSNAPYWITAATSAPKPIRVTASCATTQRFVFFTEEISASSSSGCNVRGSTP